MRGEQGMAQQSLAADTALKQAEMQYDLGNRQLAEQIAQNRLAERQYNEQLQRKREGGESFIAGRRAPGMLQGAGSVDAQVAKNEQDIQKRLAPTLEQQEEAERQQAMVA